MHELNYIWTAIGFKGALLNIGSQLLNSYTVSKSLPKNRLTK